MKPSIAPPCPLRWKHWYGQWSYTFKFILTRLFWALQKQTVVAFARISESRNGCSSWASNRRGSQEETPKRSWTPRPYDACSSSGSLRSCSLRRQLVCLWARFAPFLPASGPRRSWRDRDSGGPARPDVRKRAGCPQIGWCPIWRERSPKPTQRAGLRRPCVPSSSRDLCQKAHERRSSRRATNLNQASVNKCVWQERVWVLIYLWGLWDRNDNISLTAGRAFSMKIR